MWTTERIVIAVTVLAPASNPCSTWNGGQGDSSSFSAMHAAYLAGLPCVAWSSSRGRRPNALIAVRRSARPIVALARKPDPNTLPLLLSPIRSRTGPLTRSIAAVPVVLCQIARGT